MQNIEPVSEWFCWRMFIETWPSSELTLGTALPLYRDRRFATLQRKLFIYLINKYIFCLYLCLIFTFTFAITFTFIFIFILIIYSYRFKSCCLLYCADCQIRIKFRRIVLSSEPQISRPSATADIPSTRGLMNWVCSEDRHWSLLHTK